MMNRSDRRKQLQVGLNTVFGLEYDRYPEEWRDIYDVETSEKAYEEDVMEVGLGEAPVKPEGSAIEYDEGYETYVVRYTHETIALAFAITEEAEEDNLYGSVGSRSSKQLARALQRTKEVKGGALLNNGFDSNFPGGDGVALFSTAHPLGGGGVLSNTLGTPADLSESAMEEALIIISEWTDERGIPIRAQVKKLIVPPELMFVSTRLLMTPYQPDTSDNNVNAIYKLGSIGDGFSVNHQLTDTDAWFFITDVQDGFKHFVRRPVKKGLEGDFETGNLRYKASERYSFGFSNPRCGFGVPGA
jgi:hypothetical protein